MSQESKVFRFFAVDKITYDTLPEKIFKKEDFTFEITKIVDSDSVISDYGIFVTIRDKSVCGLKYKKTKEGNWSVFVKKMESLFQLFKRCSL